jgi:glycerol kinase
MMHYVLAIDQGTTGTTALLIDRDLVIRGKITVDFPQLPQPGMGDDPEEIWFSVLQAIRRLLQETAVPTSEIAAIGITNQRETTLLWERATGRPVGNAIVWQCRRSADICRELKEKGVEPRIREKTGLVLDPYFSGTKLTWRLRQEAQLRRRAEAGELAFGTVDSFLVWRLTGGVRHVTDVSNASRTLLMDLRSLAWDDELLGLFEVPRRCCPTSPSSQVYGHTKGWRPCRMASRWPAWPAISRRPSSARPASPPARRNAPMAPAPSCSRTPEPRLSPARAAC